MKKEKITILALHLGYGGVEQYISSLCKMLEENYKIDVIVTYKILEKPAFYFSDNINITYLIDDKPNKKELKNAIKNRNLIQIFKEGIKSFKLLFLKRTRNIKAIKKIDSKYIITTREFHNRLVGKYKNKNNITIATEHNYHNNNKKYVNQLLSSLRNIDYLVTVSEELKEYYKPKLKNTKCIYIPNVIDNILEYKEHKNISNNIVSIGRLSKEKGYGDLIDIIAIVKKTIPNIKLDIYGNGEEQNNLKEKIEELELSENIYLKGFVKNEELLNKIGCYDLYVMSSLTESFGLVLIEAMSRSLPCIAFDSANGAKFLLAKGNGILIKNRDKEKFAQSIIELLNDKKNLNKVSKKGYDSCNSFLLNNVKKEWLRLLDKES